MPVSPRRLFLGGSASPPPTSNDPRLVEVTLLSLVNHLGDSDELSSRKMFISPNSSVLVGRSSRNVTKGITAGPDNAYIDSPVVSREHAILSALNSTSCPAIYLTDKGSMHGTKVNDTSLARDRPCRLNNGDRVQFGVNVIRDHDTFIAKSYQFSARWAPTETTQPLFPRGVSVPSSVPSDDDDDDDDELEEDGTLLQLGRTYRNHSNPVYTADTEDRQRVSIAVDDGLMSPIPIPSSPSSAKSIDVNMCSNGEEIPNTPIIDISQPRCFNLCPAVDYADNPRRDDDAKSTASIEAAVNSQDEDSLYEVDSLNNLAAACSSQAEESDDSDRSEREEADEADGEADNVRRLKLGSMLNHEQQNTSSSEDIATTAQTAPAAQAAPSVPPAPLLPAPAKLLDSANAMAKPLANGQAERFRTADMEWGYPEPGINNPWPDDCTVPSRPPAPKPLYYDFYNMNTNCLREEPSREGWYDASQVSMFSGPIHDYRTPPPVKTYQPNMFDRQPAAPFSDNYSTVGKSDSVYENRHSVGTSTTTGVSSPPTSYCDDPSPPNAPQAPRTKVSIAEIVEYAPQSSPPPTSIAAPKGLKRKADVLDAEEEDACVVEVAPTEAVAETNATPVDATPVQARRPRKRFRRALNFAGTVAAGVAVGAFAVVGALTALPEGFFE